MEIATILTSLLLLAAIYVYVSIREKSYINILTPTYAFMFPADYLLETVHLTINGPAGSTYAYLLSYGTYTGYLLAFAFGYTHITVPTLRLPFASSDGKGNRTAAYFVLLAAIALYLPILIEFRDLLLTPRQIYEQTRGGYGISFFLSSTLCYLAVILLLFRKPVRVLELGFFMLVSLVFLWLHGAKGHMLAMVFIVALYRVYVQGRRVSLPRFMIFGTLLAGLGVGLFLITSPQLLTQGVAGLAGYSGYTRNGMLVIDSDLGPLYGRLTLENQLYSRVPRALFPDKPKDFGDFYLAERFYPDLFEGDQGAPAFGYGSWYADFGALALPLLLAFGLLGGALAKMFVASLERHRGPGEFILVLFACGISLLPFAGVFLLPENILFAIVANALHVLRFHPRRSAGRNAATVPSAPSAPNAA